MKKYKFELSRSEYMVMLTALYNKKHELEKRIDECKQSEIIASYTEHLIAKLKEVDKTIESIEEEYAKN